MSTAQNAFENLKLRKLGYWKLYKGAAVPGNKISQCDSDENPTGSAQVAAELFGEEINSRLHTPGNYVVNVYRNINGEKGGFKYEFAITSNERSMNFVSQNNIPQDDPYTRIRRDIEIELSLKRIEDKIDGILQYIVANSTEDKKDDNEALKFIMNLAGQAIKKNAPIAPKAVGSGFAGL